MCSTRAPRAVSASATSERWHRHGTASAHIRATTRPSASSRSFASPTSKSSVSNPALVYGYDGLPSHQRSHGDAAITAQISS